MSRKDDRPIYIRADRGSNVNLYVNETFPLWDRLQNLVKVILGFFRRRAPK